MKEREGLIQIPLRHTFIHISMRITSPLIKKKLHKNTLRSLSFSNKRKERTIRFVSIVTYAKSEHTFLFSMLVCKDREKF